MSSSASRAILRHPRLSWRRIGLRNASTTSEAASSAASKARETASEATSKASEGLSRVQSSAGNLMGSAGAAASKAAGAAQRMGGPIGRAVSFVESSIPSIIYYSRVGLEVGKIVAHGQKMSPPSIATMQSYLQPVMRGIRNPGTLFNQAPSTNAAAQQSAEGLQTLRNMDMRTLATVGVIAAETLGFFTIGEMIGRLKIVGYRSSVPAHGEH